MTLSDFDDIRPYTDEEIPAAMQRIADNPSLALVASYINPGKSLDQVREGIRNIKTVKQLQDDVMCPALSGILKKTSTGLTVTGLENLDKQKCYLFVSNHRDIVLDAMIQQRVVYDYGMDSAEITFGANLMSNPLIVDIGKSNKMFKVERPGLSVSSPRAFYECSKHLSDYIRFDITQKKQSVWIAQRNGRTKDGLDRTDVGILKMFGMSGSGDKLESMVELNIAPVSISYEWEPCDVLKTLELYETSRMKYEKKPGEDVNSIITGIIQPKGHIYVSFCEPLKRSELDELAPLTLNGFRTALAELIDRRICSSYVLTHNNYIAHDIRHASHEYADKYTEDQKKEFIAHMEQLDKYDSYDMDELRDIYLGIYANPVDSKFMK